VLDESPRHRVDVAVQHVSGSVALDPVAKAVEADVCGIVGVVVDPRRRAVGDQHVRRRKLARELARLPLGVLVRAAAAVLHAALEAGHRQAVQGGPAAMQVIHFQLLEQVGRVVVAVHADARDAGHPQRLDPGPVEIAQQDHGIDVHLLRHQRRIQRRALVGEREHPHQPASSATASPKTSVWRSTSASLVAGDMSAMLWNGVIITPRLSAWRCR
jgi:hypothetical protein